MTPEHLQTLAVAISGNEGFGIAGARPTRNHNPGDLRGWPGFPRDADGFTVFPDDKTGWDTLREDLANHARHYPDQPLMVFVGGDGQGWPGYAPAEDGNDPTFYALQLARALGCSAWALLREL